jgi:hypothetical protein
MDNSTSTISGCTVHDYGLFLFENFFPKCIFVFIHVFLAILSIKTKTTITRFYHVSPDIIL